MSANPTPKFRPVNEWPLVLVGPIVRRVTNTIENGVATGTSVAVFVATSRPCRVRLTLYDGTSPVATELPASQAEPTRIIGARLHPAVVEAVHEPALAGGHVYGYDLEFTEQGQSPRTLEDLGLLRDDEARACSLWDTSSAIAPASARPVRWPRCAWSTARAGRRTAAGSTCSRPSIRSSRKAGTAKASARSSCS